MKRLLSLWLFLLVCTGCMRTTPSPVIVITATFQASQNGTNPALPLLQTPVAGGVNGPPINPTPDPTRPVNTASPAGVNSYVVQPGDSLSAIASLHGLSVNSLLAVNNIPDPNALEVGQIIQLPGLPAAESSAFKIVPDSRLVYGPGATQFDVAGFIAAQPGYIRTAGSQVDGRYLTATEAIIRTTHEYGVDPRLLLALLEYRAGWLSNPNPSDELKNYPLRVNDTTVGIDWSGAYRQVSWAANQLNRGYYGWKQRGLRVVEFEDGTRVTYSPTLNAGSVGTQYMLSLYNTYGEWAEDIGPNGLYRTYLSLFGDPFNGAIEPLVPPNLVQPPMTFPFASGQVWFYTGGPHGGWGSGSAWSSIDFAPPDDRPSGSAACYISDYFATAVADGIVARTAEGTVILDLDGDGDETTGWVVFYLHLAEQDRISAGTVVRAGDRLGRPSCEGGYSNGTHMHIGRKYNGEWIPVSCDACAPGQERPPLVMSEWTVYGYPNQEYQGYMARGNETRLAEQGRLTPENRVSW